MVLRDAYVVLEIIDPENNIKQTIDERASNLSRWSLYWENETSRLWFSSSDVGLFLYSEQVDGTFDRLVLKRGVKECQEMPAEFYDSLPNVYKQSAAKKPECTNPGPAKGN